MHFHAGACSSQPGDHSHDHGAAHGHQHHRSRNTRGLAVTLALVASYMVVEVIGGWLTNSLALLADAGHMLSDAAALALSLFAVWIALRPATPRRTYGYYRAEILAALVNGATLVAISIYIFVEAFQRIGQPPEVQGMWMTGVAAVGLLVNLTGLWILSPGKSENLNLRGAWLHVLSDTLGSVATIAAGVLIWWIGWNWLDPAISILIGLLIIHASWKLLQEAVGVLMENTPLHLDSEHVRATMLQVEGVIDIHDLHIWTITSGMESLSAHVVVAAERPYEEVLKKLRDKLHDSFSIDHITLQLEPQDFEEHSPRF